MTLDLEALEKLPTLINRVETALEKLETEHISPAAPERLLLNIEEAAQRMSLARSTIAEYVCARKIPFVKIGKALRFDPRDLEAWIAANRVEPIVKEFPVLRKRRATA